MTRRLVLLLTLAALCSGAWCPASREATKIRFMDDCPYPVEDIRTSELWLEALFLRHGMDVSGNTAKVVLQCVGEPQEKYGQVIDGEATGPTNVWFATTHPDGVWRPLCQTAHLHEVTHALMIHATRDADRQHKHPIWKEITPKNICKQIQSWGTP